jgi:hypothetical protein
MQISFVESSDSIFVTSIVRIIHFVALIILWNTTSKIGKNENASKYYSLNVAASVLVVSHLIILLFLDIYMYFSPDLDLNYFGIAMIIAYLLVNIGYILLWTNTAKMQDDKNVSELYNLNVISSVLIGFGLLLQIISKYFVIE